MSVNEYNVFVRFFLAIREKLFCSVNVIFWKVYFEFDGKYVGFLDVSGFQCLGEKSMCVRVSAFEYTILKMLSGCV